MKKRKYKALKSGVRSFSEGFTGLLNSGIISLGQYAVEHQCSHFFFNILTNESNPDLSGQEWYPWLMCYIVPEKWFDRIGCNIDYISQFTISITFRFSVNDTSGSCIRFLYSARLIDDRNRVYTHEGRGLT